MKARTRRKLVARLRAMAMRATQDATCIIDSYSIKKGVPDFNDDKESQDLYEAYVIDSQVATRLATFFDNVESTHIDSLLEDTVELFDLKPDMIQAHYHAAYGKLERIRDRLSRMEEEVKGILEDMPEI